MVSGGVTKGNTITSQTGVARSNGMERDIARGNGAMRGRVASRWEAAALGEATQQAAGLEVREPMAWRGA